MKSVSERNIINRLPEVMVETETDQVSLTGENGLFHLNDVCLELRECEKQMQVYLRAETTEVCRVRLAWDYEVERGVKIFGDAWERGYGELEWRGIDPERVMPWYVVILGMEMTYCYGVETGPSALCYWKMDGHTLRLILDVKNGGCGVRLGGRTLHVANIICSGYENDRSAYDVVKIFCGRMCRKPRMPQNKVYGSNNWYYAYGSSSAEKILQDAALLEELANGLEERPYMVIDDGWQPMHAIACAGGPWDRGNSLFPDMKKLADQIKEKRIHPGIWFRPITTYESYPDECFLQRPEKAEGKVHYLDPSHPYVLDRIEEMTRGIAEWGYELIKHDFTTFDIFGKWGFEMGEEPTERGWHFYDTSRTAAEIVKTLYTAIRKGAGDKALILGCNTFSHLAAGIFEMQRTGDDTSGKDWERTRKMGINTLAFRMPQYGTFYAVDADCAGITDAIDWSRNREWLSLLAHSGTTMFVSIDPSTATEDQKRYIKKAFRIFVKTEREAVPCNWLDNRCPDLWDTCYGRRTYSF